MYSLRRDIQHRLFKPKPPDRPMSEEELLSWLRKFQYSAEFRSRRGRTVPIFRLCDYAQIGRSTVYHFIKHGRPIDEAGRMRLTMAIIAVQNGLRWERGSDHRYTKIVLQYERLGDSA